MAAMSLSFGSLGIGCKPLIEPKYCFFFLVVINQNVVLNNDNHPRSLLVNFLFQIVRWFWILRKRKTITLHKVNNKKSVTVFTRISAAALI